jgi:mannitol-1-/sugar-/sorbitol-6-phosphatase
LPTKFSSSARRKTSADVHSPLPTEGFRAFVFDMDGTILSSIASAERVWTRWALRHGVDVARFLPMIHGVRAVETVARLALPGIDPVAEAAIITRQEIEDVEGTEAIAGAATFLSSLPSDRWGIATSAPRALAERRLSAAELPIPSLMITAEDVVSGKPSPDCYLLAARCLGISGADCLVFEDAIAGISAAEAASASVLVITATHKHELMTSHPSLRDFDTIVATVGADGLLRLKTKG